VHLDGYNLLPFLRDEAKDSARDGFLYFGATAATMAIRVLNWKISFMEGATHRD
jgi:hypothetical protein